jgi:hypothetical protein
VTKGTQGLDTIAQKNSGLCIHLKYFNVYSTRITPQNQKKKKEERLYVENKGEVR